jgi:branched-chain amino acid transport system substrate-binding protein
VIVGIELADAKTPEVIEAKVKAFLDHDENKTSKPEWIWVGNTTATTVLFVKALKKLGASSKVMTNVWGFDENVPTTCGADCRETLHGTLPFAGFGDQEDGMAQVKALHQEYRDLKEGACEGIKPEWCACTESITACSDVRYVQGHVSFMLWKAAIESIVEKNPDAKITGPMIKAALESFASFSTGGLTAPLSFTDKDHRPQNAERIYTISKTDTLLLKAKKEVPLEAKWLGW